MSATHEHVTVDFDHHTPITEVYPDDAYASLRTDSPVAWTNAHGGYWVVTGYEEATRVLRGYRDFSSRDGMTIPPHPVGISIPVHLDPPEHSGYRRAMNPYMTKEAVAQLSLRIREITTHYIDRVIEQGHCDLAYDVAVPIPGSVTLEWMGWEQRDEWERISVAWHDLLSYPLDHPRTKHSHEDLAWFTGRLSEELDLRREAPRDDILTYVATLEIGGEPIDPQKALEMATVWIAGGVDTATTAILGGIVHFNNQPEHREALAQEPELWSSAINELLRRHSPTRTTARTAIHDVEVGGCLIREGDRVLVSLSSANQDGREFADPLTVKLDRTPNRHMAFGTGIHRCVGLYLAQAELREVLGQVLRRMPDYRLDESRLLPYVRQSEMQGWTSAPATFTPNSREGHDVLRPIGAA